MNFDFDTPEGRLRAIESLGPEAYNAAFEQHLRGTIICIENGYPIRPVMTRFGRLYQVAGTGSAFILLPEAKKFANEQTPGAGR